MTNDALIDSLFRQMKGRHVWVMDLANYRRLRAIFWSKDHGDEGDPETANPDPGDRLLGYPIEVREDGGEPHIEWALYDV